jgi:hypothetical protein
MFACASWHLFLTLGSVDLIHHCGFGSEDDGRLLTVRNVDVRLHLSCTPNGGSSQKRLKEM